MNCDRTRGRRSANGPHRLPSRERQLAAALIVLLIIGLGVSSTPAQVPNDFIRGDTDGTGARGAALVHAIFLYQYLFFPATPVPPCMDAADANDDGDVNLLDVIYVLFSMFVPGFPSIPPPGPLCGPDPTPDGLDCETYPCP